MYATKTMRTSHRCKSDLSKLNCLLCSGCGRMRIGQSSAAWGGADVRASPPAPRPPSPDQSELLEAVHKNRHDSQLFPTRSRAVQILFWLSTSLLLCWLNTVDLTYTEQGEASTISRVNRSFGGRILTGPRPFALLSSSIEWNQRRFRSWRLFSCVSRRYISSRPGFFPPWCGRSAGLGSDQRPRSPGSIAGACGSGRRRDNRAGTPLGTRRA